MTDKQLQPSAAQFTSLRQPVFCSVSGAVLGTLEVSIVEGNLPFVQNFNEVQLLHPFFGQTDYNLLRKFDESLKWFAEHGWQPNLPQLLRLQVLMSATMHRMGSLKQETQTLPSYAITAGCAHRLYVLAKWFLMESSRRSILPTFSVAKRNDNLQWENLRFWLDEVAEVRERWRTRVSEIERETELRSKEVALREVMSSHTRRVNLKNVWGWIELQLKMAIKDGRLETWKSLFMTGDLAPEDWLADDVDDLSEAIAQHCDIGNEIMYFVRNRLQAIREQIIDFYDSFTIVRTSVSSVTHQNNEKEDAILGEYDAKLEILGELPPAPQQKDFATVGLFLRAQAQHNILKSRWELIQKRNQDKGQGETK